MLKPITSATGTAKPLIDTPWGTHRKGKLDGSLPSRPGAESPPPEAGGHSYAKAPTPPLWSKGVIR